MYFVGEEAIADTDITQVLSVLLRGRCHVISYQAKWGDGKILVNYPQSFWFLCTGGSRVGVCGAGPPPR